MRALPKRLTCIVADLACGDHPQPVLADIETIRMRTGVIAVLMSLVSLTGAAAGTICPQAQTGSGLRSVTLFDGPPSEQVSLAPDSSRKMGGADRSEWNVADVAASDRHLYVTCDYGPKSPALTFRQPASTIRCSLVSRRRSLALICSGP